MAQESSPSHKNYIDNFSFSRTSEVFDRYRKTKVVNVVETEDNSTSLVHIVTPEIVFKIRRWKWITATQRVVTPEIVDNFD